MNNKPENKSGADCSHKPIAESETGNVVWRKERASERDNFFICGRQGIRERLTYASNNMATVSH